MENTSDVKPSKREELAGGSRKDPLWRSALHLKTRRPEQEKNGIKSRRTAGQRKMKKQNQQRHLRRQQCSHSCWLLVQNHSS